MAYSHVAAGEGTLSRARQASLVLLQANQAAIGSAPKSGQERTVRFYALQDWDMRFAEIEQRASGHRAPLSTCRGDFSDSVGTDFAVREKERPFCAVKRLVGVSLPFEASRHRRTVRR
jgi:hypothetical protein